MDEILIEDKKYVSSKRAAKITGYAKDYIGQLCREGRVPARFVGRSWYVLESAIADHRFGDQKSEEEIKEESTVQPVSNVGTPRYFAATAEILPPVHRIEEKAVPPEDEHNEAPQQLQDSWRAWFDFVTKKESETPVSPEDEDGREESTPEMEPEAGDGEVNIPIHTVYELPPEDLLPRKQEASEVIEQEQPQIRAEKRAGAGMKLMNIIGLALAAVTVLVSMMNTGYFDKNLSWIYTNSTLVGSISGASVYSKK